MKYRMDIIAKNGVPFRVVYDPYITRPNGQHDGLVKFYDLRFPHTPDGQFVSDYYRSDLQKHPYGYDLNLHGGVDNWTIDLHAFNMIKLWFYLPWPKEGNDE